MIDLTTRCVEIAGVVPVPDSFWMEQAARNLNVYAERFVLSIKSGRPDRMIPREEHHLRRAAGEYIEHYHLELIHQGLGNRRSSRTTARQTTFINVLLAPDLRRQRIITAQQRFAAMNASLDEIDRL